MSKAFRLGAFIIASLLIFGGAVFWIGSKQFLFTRTYTLNADFTTVSGLTDGAAVRVGGIHEGTVKYIALPHRPNEKIRVIMSLKGSTKDVIKKDSVAAIRSEGLVGDKYVEIYFGTDGAPAVKNGDTIGTEVPLDISDLIKKTNGILDSAQTAMKNVDATAGNLADVSGKIDRGTGTVGALINDRSIYQNMNKAATALQEDTEAMKHNFLTSHFFKSRGYEDEAELAKHAIAAPPKQPPDRKFEYDAAKIFDKPDNAKLKRAKMLNDAGAYLQSNPFGLAVIEAYMDDKGDSEKDRTLSQARATVARDYLVQNFKVDDSRIKTLGLGKTQNAASDGLQVLVYR